MKTLRSNSVQALIIFLLVSITVLAQPLPTIVTKLPKAPTGVTYAVYADVKPTNTTSVLVEDLDILVTNVSSYLVTLSNVTVSGDTTFGEFTVPASTNTQYVKCGVVATQTGKKPSLMKVTSWLAISPRTLKPATFEIKEK